MTLRSRLHAVKTSRSRSGARGFTLVEIAVVIIVIGFLMAMLIGIASSMVGQQRREATRQRLVSVETAIALFVSQNLRLPCPADGRVDGATANAGLEQRAAANCNVGSIAGSQQHGVVPWRALGMSEQDVTDGWGNRLTYRVDPDFVNEAAMNFSKCDPAGTGGKAALDPGFGYCLSGCTTPFVIGACTRPANVVAGEGLRVQNLAGSATMDPASGSGAAYVVISHGENGAGAYATTGILQAASTTDSGTEEAARNFANVAFLPGTSSFVDDFPVFAAGAGHFDDFVLRPSILAVATKAQLGPRAH